MYKLLKSIYTGIPGKVYLYKVAKLVYTPSPKIAGYLKFKGDFSVKLGQNKSVKIKNDFSTLPSIIFWNGLEGYEKRSVETWIELSKTAEVTLDLGANFGLFGLISKALNPNAVVVLVEPLERNVNRVQNNLDLNKFDAEVITAAIGDHLGAITFFDMDASENTIGSIDKNFVEMHQHSTSIIPIEVPMITIDHLVETRQLKKVDLIKIDVEGADFLAIKGAIQTLNTFHPNILIEITNPENANNIDQLLTTLPVKYFIYEINETEGLIARKAVSRDSASRNYLLSTLPTHELQTAFPKLFG